MATTSGWARAASAAAVSASFLLGPEPSARAMPFHVTRATKDLRWSGPSSETME